MEDLEYLGNYVLAKSGKDEKYRPVNITDWFKNDKGLVIYGNYRTGKTILAKVIRYAYLLCDFRINFYSSIELTEIIKAEGIYRNKLCRQPMIIDDLGKESGIVNNYGTKEFPIITLIYAMIENNTPFIITTNKDVKGKWFQDRYTEWITKRLDEYNDFLKL